jgi:hypothetical protein
MEEFLIAWWPRGDFMSILKREGNPLAVVKQFPIPMRGEGKSSSGY